jgi:hypothetical protein
LQSTKCQTSEVLGNIGGSRSICEVGWGDFQTGSLKNSVSVGGRGTSEGEIGETLLWNIESSAFGNDRADIPSGWCCWAKSMPRKPESLCRSILSMP